MPAVVRLCEFGLKSRVEVADEESARRDGGIIHRKALVFDSHKKIRFITTIITRRGQTRPATSCIDLNKNLYHNIEIFARVPEFCEIPVEGFKLF